MVTKKEKRVERQRLQQNKSAMPGNHKSSSDSDDKKKKETKHDEEEEMKEEEQKNEMPTRRRSRVINNKTARGMLNWGHFRFRQLLLSKSREYPSCKVVICDEHYTSKTCGACGFVYRDLGGRKVFNFLVNICFWLFFSFKLIYSFLYFYIYRSSIALNAIIELTVMSTGPAISFCVI